MMAGQVQHLMLLNRKGRRVKGKRLIMNNVLPGMNLHAEVSETLKVGKHFNKFSVAA